LVGILQSKKMKLGDQFQDFEDFEKVFKQYKDTNFVDFSVHDCKTLESIRAKHPGGKGNAPGQLKYYYIKYICVHGGVYKKRKICLNKRITS